MIRFYLTFDVEDFINSRSTLALRNILEILDDRGFTGIFFITGHKAEELKEEKEVLNCLSDHIIGYHSSSHSVRPTIPEFTDIGNYKFAKKISKKRETSYIDPLTGEIKGKGGIKTLLELFSDKNIDLYRAPGLSWSPPHTEALIELGINKDFSTSLFPYPLQFKDISFFPFPTEQSVLGLLLKVRDMIKSSEAFLRRKEVPVVLLWHPSGFVNEKSWDFFYRKKNPRRLEQVPPLSETQRRKNFNTFSSILDRLSFFERATNIVKVKDSVEDVEKRNFEPNVMKEYDRIAFWVRKRFEYEPTHLKNHLKYFLDESV
ncbi:hypothetical protein AKJ52_01180 [candidate division MSBL1 archaeon SCGC-AAA382C18]|uniref:NodB homology domain-containing protein n=1 Tax=candidate division MSBL1 archaeon SCGC-AAA382C18 TaxID=1698281 RepID=A0A133VKP8_9EURY|nr:hypothetical protein AKJ52_01180 [candidate division MSBL1 archaeon SCGC-AAA382C18]